MNKNGSRSLNDTERLSVVQYISRGESRLMSLSRYRSKRSQTMEWMNPALLLAQMTDLGCVHNAGIPISEAR